MKPKLKLTLVITMDETPNIEWDAADLKAAIQNRIFGQGVFGPDTLVDEWLMNVEITDG